MALSIHAPGETKNIVRAEYGKGDLRFMKPAYQIRPLEGPDVAKALEIFNSYTTEGFSAFPEEPVSPDLFSLVIHNAYQAFVADSKKEVDGFAILRPFSPFPAFSGTGMVTYFVRRSRTRKGIGTRLLAAVENAARKRRITILIAEISSRNSGSLAFHSSRGFSECGRIHDAGRKFGEPFDLVWMEKKVENSFD